MGAYFKGAQVLKGVNTDSFGVAYSKCFNRTRILQSTMLRQAFRRLNACLGIVSNKLHAATAGNFLCLEPLMGACKCNGQ